ncbi:hypothetical protein BAUCODRAFT_151406 [Baudoinia panamericana UAMH 10762]|uniref:WW domain-containing protein n=1 Tax=Baudoinia panamericana (strain UAMH 10762) TaxID=717646 RepID=M2MNL1_BAUPA|nr:uncharacterized protein BAUCODRAFT_151406 [Baudoinia panamericana UAMH 10762]EMC93033.1 hypothetical protein BAUCODRAFT_151406 [Baudoinia panamericana UAMH 10762]
MAMPPLPPGWQWDFDAASQRWCFLHVSTGHKQTNFPNAGDEQQANFAAAPSEEFYLLQGQQPLHGQVTATTTVVTSQPTKSDDDLTDFARVTAAMASVSMGVAPESTVLQVHAPSPVAIDMPMPREAAKLAQTDAPPLPVATPATSTASPCPSPLGAQTLHSTEQQVFYPAPAAAPSVFMHRTQPVWSDHAASSAHSSATAPNPPAGDRMPKTDSAVSFQPADTSSSPVLYPVQSTPQLQQVQYQHRPDIHSVASAPQVMQSFQPPPTPSEAADQGQGTTDKDSKMKKMSKGFGKWVKEHPKMAIGGAALVEVAGLAMGVDPLRDAATTYSHMQNHKAKKAAQQHAGTSQQGVPMAAPQHPNAARVGPTQPGHQQMSATGAGQSPSFQSPQNVPQPPLSFQQPAPSYKQTAQSYQQSAQPYQLPPQQYQPHPQQYPQTQQYPQPPQIYQQTYQLPASHQYAQAQQTQNFLQQLGAQQAYQQQQQHAFILNAQAQAYQTIFGTSGVPPAQPQSVHGQRGSVVGGIMGGGFGKKVAGAVAGAVSAGALGGLVSGALAGGSTPANYSAAAADQLMFSQAATSVASEGEYNSMELIDGIHYKRPGEAGYAGSEFI